MSANPSPAAVELEALTRDFPVVRVDPFEAGGLALTADDVRAWPVPKTRGDCREGPRPCPWTCRYRLWNEAESCALDVADKGPATLQEVGDLLGLSRERIRQIERKALVKIRRAKRLDEHADHKPGGDRPGTFEE